MKTMNKFLKKAGLILAQTVAALSLVAMNTYAVSITDPISAGTLTVAGAVNNIIKIVFGVGIVVCIVFLIYYGIKYITAGDDVKAIEGARKGITGAIIGLIVILLSFAIIKMIAVFFGLGSDSIFNILPDSFVFT